MSNYRPLGLAGSALLALGGAGCGALPGADPFVDWPVVRELRAVPTVAAALACLGLTFLVTAWLRLGARIRLGTANRAPHLSPREMVTTLLWWAAPLAVAPPLFSRDVYSYLAQGAMALHGINPYHYGPAMLGGPLDRDIPPIWQFTPTPYGPVFIGAAITVMRTFGVHTVPAILGMRVVALAGMALVAHYGPELARRAGVDPGAALWLGLLNPLVLVHFVGGAHNDALMVGLIVLGFSLVARGREATGTERDDHAEVAGIVAIALAVLVKAPAALALLFVVPLIAVRGALPRSWTLGSATGHTPTQDRRGLVWAAAKVAAVTTTTVVAVTVGVGLGYGWVRALHTPTRAHNGLSLSTDLGLLLGYPVGALGLATPAQVLSACRAIGLLAAAVVVVAALARSRRLGPLYTLGIALTAVVVLAPVVHPWYLLWGFIPLALGAPDGRVRRTVVAVSVVAPFALMPDGERRPVEMLAGAAGVAVAVALLGLRRPRGDVVQGEPVPVDAEPADDPGGDRGHDGVAPELLPRVDVGDVHLDERAAQQGTGVAQRVRVV
jgi:hypothetical protein